MAVLTRDELVEKVREYVEREFPAWRWASLMIHDGDTQREETLLITPLSSASSPRSASRRPRPASGPAPKVPPIPRR